ncbi:MAG: ABC transporter ATP-binding protein [Planctomycetota bacterium]|jgi:NitT/TauT family transport system ATP-binding protein|nr:ABC transporter ATP-binding protein [Planctomycetota bacterium]MDP6503436.1 ABC transporter ATP-binding protein [Planctomycetota bacterium]
MLVEASDLNMTFEGGIDALKGIDLSIREGEFVSIVGSSGCGKTTLLRILAGLQQGYAGQVSLSGMPPLDARQSQHDVSFVFQEANLLPWRHVLGNVMLPLELRQDSRSVSEIHDLLELVGLHDFAHAFPRQLSGGMKMRASLARALVTRPDLLLMDEPFGALDELTRQRLNEELLGLWERDKWTCLFVTHNVFEAVFMSERVIVMKPRPGSIAAEIEVPLEYPRRPELRAEPEFARVVGKVSAALREHGE